MSNPEYDALQALVESEGWKLWTEHVDAEWGAVGFAGKIARTIGDPNLKPELAVHQLQQATVAQQAVQGVRDWPKQRMRQLLKPPQPAEALMSRRGPGL